MSKTFHTTIMRRVYYAYAVGLVANAMFIKGFLLAVLWGLFTTFVSVRDVLVNVAELRAAEILPYLATAFWNTEVWTMLTCIAMAAVGFMVLRSFVSVRFMVRA